MSPIAKHGGQNANGAFVQELSQDPDKGIVNGLFFKERQAGHGSVKDVVDIAGIRTSSLSRNAASLSLASPCVKKT